MYTIYSVSIVLFFAILSPYFLYQALRYRKYVRNLPQRLGYLPLSFNFDGEESIWIQAVSVGEVLTVRALLPQLRERYPRLRIFLSTTTMTGQHVAHTSVQGVDGVFYFPLDLPLVVRRTLAVVKPRLFIMMETELWPNLLRECRRAGVKTALVNGRISARSHPRYLLARRFFRRVLSDVDRFCMQSEESARRIVEIGAPRERVSVTGSLKFDSLEIPGTMPDRGRNRVLRYFRIPPERPVIIAASTLRGEEEPVLDAFQRIRATWGNALLIIAPRKPERFAEAERLAQHARLARGAAQGAGRRRRTAGRRGHPRHDRRAGAALSGRHAGVRRRQPCRRRRPQHPRAGGVRQADRLRPAHAQLRRDLPHVPRESRRGPGALGDRARDRARRPALRSGAACRPWRRGPRAGRSQSRRAAAVARRHHPAPAVGRLRDGAAVPCFRMR